jgi:hypothetical protein
VVERQDHAFSRTGGLNVIERLPGWKGRYFHTATMTFAHYDFTRGSTIHGHFGAAAPLTDGRAMASLMRIPARPAPGFREGH